jgi:hypothetical protein
MATYKNWLTSNIVERKDTGLDLKVTLTKIDEWELDTSFEEASINIVKTIANLNKPLYIGLSGGLDSEYVCRIFDEEYVSYTPVIIETPGNQLELSYAYKFCKKYNKEPVIIKKTEADMLHHYYDEILVKCSGFGHNSVAMYIIGQYAKDRNGIFVMGEHLIDEKEKGGFNVGANEWDFYNDLILGEDNTHYFFNYTPEISYAMIRDFPIYKDIQKCKSELYGLEYRPKMIYQYSDKYVSTLRILRHSKMLPHNPNFTFGDRDTYLDLLKSMRDKDGRTKSNDRRRKQTRRVKTKSA